MNYQETHKEEMEAAVAALHPIDSYQEQFVSHCQDNRPRLSTGLLTLDKALSGGLTSELYVLAAETSTGKSAFLMSIAQKIAQAGTDVLYFALEMGKEEFIARGISSVSYEQYLKVPGKKPVTVPDILLWSYDEVSKSFSKLAYSTYEEYCKEYFQRYGEHLFIVENCLNGLSVKKIANTAALFKKNRGAVVVFVDSLQMIKADPEDYSQSDRKTKTDATITTLKNLAAQVGVPVLTSSSVSRNNYGREIAISSFKESGEIEYAGGVLLGWNWSGVTDQKDEMWRAGEKKDCEDRGYRNITLKILKNKYAACDDTIYLKYFPAYQYFKEEDSQTGLPGLSYTSRPGRKRH